MAPVGRPEPVAGGDLPGGAVANTDGPEPLPPDPAAVERRVVLGRVGPTREMVVPRLRRRHGLALGRDGGKPVAAAAGSLPQSTVGCTDARCELGRPVAGDRQ